MVTMGYFCNSRQAGTVLVSWCLSTITVSICLSWLTATEKSIIEFWWYKSSKVKSKNQIPDRAKSLKILIKAGFDFLSRLLQTAQVVSGRVGGNLVVTTVGWLVTLLLADMIIGTKLTTTDWASSSQTCLAQVYHGGDVGRRSEKYQPRHGLMGTNWLEW